MKDKYIDDYGLDSLPSLILAAKCGCNIFLTVNEDMLKDRKELQEKFHIKIVSPGDRL